MDTLPVIVSLPEDDDDVKGLFTARADTALRQIPVEILRTSLSSLCVCVLRAIEDRPKTGEMRLREVSFAVEVTASGSVALVGTASLGGKGAVTLKFAE